MHNIEQDTNPTELTPHYQVGDYVPLTHKTVRNYGSYTIEELRSDTYTIANTLEEEQ